MKSLYSVDVVPPYLVEWLRTPARAQLRHTVVIGSRCCSDLPSLGESVALHLNQQALATQRQWQAFSVRDLWHFAGVPAHRQTILANAAPDRHPGSLDSDLDRIIRRLARLGGAVLEGQYTLDATTDLHNTFRVCLCSKGHECPEPCDILFNPEDHDSRAQLAASITTAFLVWKPSHPVGSDFHLAR